MTGSSINDITLPMVDAPEAPPKLPHELLLPEEYNRAEFESHLPYMGFQPGELNSQQEKFVHLVVSGMPPGAAAVAVGMPAAAGGGLMGRDIIKKAIEFFRNRNREKLDFTIETAHTMLMEAWTNSKDATEQVAVVRELVKLHGVAAPPKVQKVDINIQGPRQLERASDEDLLQAAGVAIDFLLPTRSKPKKEPEPIIDGEFTEVKEA